ncbi:MAG: hypothetical protein IT210_00915 [Armatimonadetes bacterium]|nr:hypothetical protein [Armatimonadota bacterium]
MKRRSLRAALWALCLAAGMQGICFGATVRRKAALTPQKDAPLAIAVYPKGQVVMEINLSEKDLLPMLQHMLSTTKFPVPADTLKTGEIDLTELGAALQGLKRVRVQIYRLSRTVPSDQVARFYNEKMKAQGWSQVFWHAANPNDVFAFFSLGRDKGIFFMNSRLLKPKQGAGWVDVTVGRTEGMIDMVRLVNWASRMMAASQQAPPAKEPAGGGSEPAQGGQGAPPPPPPMDTPAAPNSEEAPQNDP